MNSDKHSIWVITYFFVFLFLGMVVYLGYTVQNGQQDMLNNTYNTRQEQLARQNARGTIYAGGGEILAQTVTDSDGLERRVYPYENLFAHVVGYSTRGKMGIEAQNNYDLIHSNIPLSQKAENRRAEVKNPGDDVYTTLNTALQRTASVALDGYKGGILVTEVKTGKILAMVSKPDFDPNAIEQLWDSLMEDKESGRLFNRCTQGLYPPGSTFKIVTALAYIRENPDTYKSYHFNCTGSFQSKDNMIHCYHKTKHGEVDFETSFAKSCNSSFANIGEGLKESTLEVLFHDLLFNQDLPLPAPYARSEVPVGNNIDAGERIQRAIGQGSMQLSPIHLHMITSAIANRGILMKPYVTEKVISHTGIIIRSFEPKEYRKLVTEKEAGILKDLMTEVVEKGTGRRLSGLTYTAAGKTGSAEYNHNKGDSHAWFTGFAPAEEPEICVTVIMEGAGSGGEYAVPVAKRIFDAYFDVS